MMGKNRVFRFVLPLVAALLLASCGTTVSVSHMVPAEVNMASYRDIAVLNTVLDEVYRDCGSIYFDDLGFWLDSGVYEGDLPICDWATGRLKESLSSTGYFRFVPESDAKATIQMHIDYLRIRETPHVHDRFAEREETVDGKTRKVKILIASDYSLDQYVALGLSWVVKDRESGTVLASDSYSDSRSVRTDMGMRTYSLAGVGYADFLEWSYPRAPSLNRMIEEMIDSFQSEIVRTISPTLRTQRIRLLSNKPKSENAALAYKLVDEGDMEAARDRFLSVWKDEGQVHAGANAALLMESLGDLQDAKDLIDQVSALSQDEDVLRLQEQITLALASQQAAEAQYGQTE